MMRMKLMYEGTDITDRVDLHRCMHDMYATGQADTLKLMINDDNKDWDGWNTKTGDKVRVISNDVDTGVMFVSQLRFEDGFLNLTATSAPRTLFDRRRKTWVDVTFLRIAQDIAGRHGLTLKTYSVEDKKYKILQQDSESDASFLNRRCRLEGCGFLVFNKKLILYSIEAMEKQEAVKEITLADEEDFKATKTARYGSCTFQRGKYAGTYKSGAGGVYIPEMPFEVTSSAEANRFAKNLLKEQNRKTQTGSKTFYEIDKGCAAATVITIRSEQVKSWNGAAFLTHVRNDYIHNKSKLFFWKI